MLHGSIQINGAVIGAWRIVRKDKLTGKNDPHRYSYAVALNDKRYEGEVEHRYLEGAPKLLSLVFADMWTDAYLDPTGQRRLEGFAERIMEVQDL